MKLFTDEGRFLRGNLHMHTSMSDGRVSAEEAIRRYREEGYDFISITDHRRRYGGAVWRKDGSVKAAGFEQADILEGGQTVEESLTGTDDYAFLIVPGTEFDRNFLSGGPEHAYHITGTGIRRFIPQTGEWSPQQIVDAIHEAGGYATLAHPIWSLMTFDECLELQGYDATEIYNTVSEVYSGRGTSDIYVDMMASRGRYVNFTAVDDTHYYERDPFGGWIMVQAGRNNWPSIHEALLAGRFYSTQGPEIRNIETMTENGRRKVRVTMSPVRSIRFMTNALYNGGRTVFQKGEGLLTEASYVLSDMDRYVRVEGRDARGKVCWSNIIINEEASFA